MSTLYPCLRAEIAGGTFIHETWDDCVNARLIALVDSSYTAEMFCRMLAEKCSPEDGRHWIITNATGGNQERWNRKRVDAERAKAGAA